ncbi:MAG: hypothetical protein PHT62_01635 [Desulfotomaculaceae bacterium]|nr:hypothetical protein [Desulfotomaculaceae bacterium]
MEEQEKIEVQELTEEHPYRNKKGLKIFILVLTIAVFVIPVFVVLNMLKGRPPFLFF